MTLDLAARPAAAPLTRRDRRRLAHRDRVSARLAELSGIGDLLRAAAARVQAGWCQDAWVGPAVPLAGAQVSHVHMGNLQEGVCLVAAIRVSGEDPRSQPVQRAIDVAWHTLHADPEGVRWVAPPGVRLARVRDLARWNDRPGRRVDEVVDLLHASAGTAGREMARLRLSLT